MPNISALLAPIDFSERSAPCARYARFLASEFDCPLILLHAIAPLRHEFDAAEIGGSMIEEVRQQQRERASRDLQFFAAQLGADDWIVADGDPAQAIVDTAHRRAGLILMPTHGYGRFRRFILGSTTAKVLHDADCPVWTGVHLEEAPPAPPPLRRILCAVDLGPQSSRALCWAASLALRFGAALTLAHITLGEPATARAELERLRDFVRAEASIAVETGDPASAICAAASREHADVVVIGRGSAAGVYGRLRANAYSIIRQSPCPVVSV